MTAEEFILNNSKQFCEAKKNGLDIRMDESEILKWMQEYAEHYHAEKLKELLPSKKQVMKEATNYADKMNDCWVNDYSGYMAGALDIIEKFKLK